MQNIDGYDAFNLIVWGSIFLILIVEFFRSIRIVPNKYAYVVERFGQYHKTLGPGFHALIPFIDRVAFIQDLKEQTIYVPPQDCFSKDEVNVVVDGVLYICQNREILNLILKSDQEVAESHQCDPKVYAALLNDVLVTDKDILFKNVDQYVFRIS